MSNDTIAVFIGSKIRSRRQKLGMSLADVGKILGITPQQVHKYEHGLSMISASGLLQLTHAFGVALNYFYVGADVVLEAKDKMKDSSIPLERTAPINVLVVEDDPMDVFLIQNAIQDSTISARVYTLSEGEKLSAMLKNPSANLPRPDIILLDLNIPKKNGLTILSEIKAEVETCDIPVIILTCSMRKQEMMDAYRHNASGYIYKSFDIDVFRNNISSTLQYWSEAVVLPYMV